MGNNSTQPINMSLSDKLDFPPPLEDLENITQELFKQLLKETNNLSGIYKIERIRSPLQEQIFLGQRECFRNFVNNGNVCIAYHGTSNTVLESISDLGLLDPNHPKYVRKTGNRFGKGVYVSKNINYAKRYARPSVLVVAILEGELKKLSSSEASKKSHLPLEDFSILVGEETVLQSSSQVLPLFILETNNNNIVKSKVLTSPVKNIKNLEDVPLFDFITVLQKHIPLAEKLKTLYPKVSFGILLHLCERAEAQQPGDTLNWAIDYLNTFDLENV